MGNKYRLSVGDLAGASGPYRPWDPGAWARAQSAQWERGACIVGI